jgi:triosephosphate isomerase (TIM)
MRTPLIAGNWKMNTTAAEAVNLVKEMLPGLEQINSVEKVVCPPFISLVPVAALLEGSPIKVGAQNMYFEEKGAYTGETSPLMLKNLCQYVILGHSERRQYFQETGASISKKVRAAQKAGLKPILCVGERLEDYEAKRTAEVVTAQLESSLDGIESLDGLTIAYEPVWAIGTGKAATGQQANETIALIRSVISHRYGSDFGENIRILYGGSVTAANIAEFVGQPDIDGALVGGASLKAVDFVNIVKQTAQIKGK